MFAPDGCPNPIPGKVLAWSRTNFCGGMWLIIGENRKIITQFGDPLQAARYVNDANRKVDEVI